MREEALAPSLLVNLSFQPGRARQLARGGGGWARRAQASPRFVSVYGTIKSDAGRRVFLVDKLENLNNMGFYEN